MHYTSFIILSIKPNRALIWMFSWLKKNVFSFTFFLEFHVVHHFMLLIPVSNALYDYDSSTKHVIWRWNLKFANKSDSFMSNIFPLQSTITIYILLNYFHRTWYLHWKTKNENQRKIILDPKKHQNQHLLVQDKGTYVNIWQWMPPREEKEYSL